MANDRAVKLIDGLLADLRDFVVRHEVSYEEYRSVVMFLHEAGQAGEVPLLMDVFLESTVNRVCFQKKPGTPACIEGPYYVPESTELSAPVVLPQRDGEPGEPLLFSGTVTSATDGTAIGGARLDVWHSTADGFYSNIHPNVPPMILRGRFVADEQGQFEFRSIVPVPYEIPKQGPTGRLLEAILGRHTFRPAHIHFKVTAPGYELLTTQIYFEGGEWLGSDVAGADQDARLVVPVERRTEPKDYEEAGFSSPYASASYEFALGPA